MGDRSIERRLVATYRQLEGTTLKTWLDWFPENIVGAFNRRTMTHHLQIGDSDCKVLSRLRTHVICASSSPS